MTHLHIYSFCGQPGCKDRPYHANTENLVSPQLSQEQVITYFIEKYEEDGDPDTYVVMPCEGVCINPDGHWLYVRQTDPLMAAVRPNHYDPTIDYAHASSVWAKR